MNGGETPADMLRQRNTHPALHDSPTLLTAKRPKLVRILHRNSRIY
jgi:hypothetical protein